MPWGTAGGWDSKFVPYVTMPRWPVAVDNTYNVPSLWLDTVGNNLYALVDITAGVATWILIAAGAGPSASISPSVSPSISPSPSPS